MQLQGIEPRAQQAKAALNRLHHEITYAFDQRESIPDGQTGMDLAEILAIAAQIGKLIDQHLPEGDPRRDQFVRELQFMRGHHEVPR